jgi:hypothetical protein
MSTKYSVFQKSLFQEEKTNSALLRIVIPVETCVIQEWGKGLAHVYNTFCTIFVIQYLRDE